MTRLQLKKLRTKLGVTTQELSRMSGYSWDHIRKMEAGIRNITPRAATLFKIIYERHKNT